MKKLCFLAVVLSLLGSGVWAATLTNWVGPTGSFADNSKWSGNNGPSTWTSTATGDEVKICVENAICTLDSDVTAYNCDHRLSVAMGPNGSTLSIVTGANAVFGETRIGAQGATATGSIGRVTQTGGSVTYRDLLLGRAGSSGVSPGTGFYTISGGSIGYTTTNGRLYVGCGNSATVPNYTVGNFKVVGNDATILFRALWVGGNTGTYGTGTIEYQVDPDGVSPITVDGTCNLDIYTTDPTLSKTYLVVSATGATTPQSDIVLVKINNTTTAAITVNGRFDTLNGGSAAEGTEILLGDNVYKLTYVYNADGDGRQNDIALVHVANLLDLAHNPNPAKGATVETSLSSLSWTNPTGGVITCDVYLGKDPNRPAMNKKVLGAGVSSVAINTTNFPTYGALTNKTTYYWVVDVHDSSEPNVLKGIFWSFYTDNNDPPVVNAGADQVKWLGIGGTPVAVSLDGTATDDGLPSPPAAMTYTWTRVSGPTTVVINSPSAVDTTVTVSERGTYVFELKASDNEKQTTDTVQVIVGTTACDASHMITDAAPYDAGDQNQDCRVDLKDFAALLSTNWLDCTDTLTNCGI